MTDIQVYPDGRLVFEGKTYRCAVGKAGVGSNKMEKDNLTPAGTYGLRKVFYRADKIAKPETKLKTIIIHPDDGWCDDPTQSDYNQLVKLPHPGTCEKLWRDDDIYDIVIPIGYNDNPSVAGKGSAIFKHIAREGYVPTEGCVSLSMSDLLEILTKVNTDTKICIHQSND